MEQPIQKFRSTAFGGFNRQDVLDYIEKTAQDYQSQFDSLNTQLTSLQQERDELQASLNHLRDESGGLAEQEAKVRASLEESTRSLTTVRGELQTTRTQLAVARRELSSLQEKVVQLEPLAKRYEALKDRIATVELDAHQKAQDTVAQAQEEAQLIRSNLSRWLDQLEQNYALLRSQVRACMDTAAQTQEAFSSTEAEYEALIRHVRDESETSEAVIS